MAAVAYPLAGRPAPARPRLVCMPAGGRGPRPAAVRRPAARVYRRRRAVALAAAGLIAVLALIGCLALRAALTGPGGGPLSTTGAAGVGPMEPAAAQIHIVQPGETLWAIVLASGVQGDPRPVVDRLAAQLDGRPLQVGQRLLLP